MNKVKIMCLMSLGLSFFCETNAVNRAIVPVRNNKLSMRSNDCEIGTIAVRSVEDNRTVRRIPSRQYGDSFEFIGENQDEALVAIDEGYISEGDFRRERTIEIPYHCDRTFLGLEPAGRDSSYAIYSLSADTEELGRILLSRRFVDRSTVLPHQTRWTNEQYDDENMRTVGTLITFVMDRNNIEREVSRVPNSSRPYEYRTEHDERYDQNPNGEDNVRVYIRPNGEQLRRNWDGTVLVEKSSRPQPIATNVAKLMFKHFDLLNILQWEYRLNSGLPYFAEIHKSKD